MTVSSAPRVASPTATPVFPTPPSSNYDDTWTMTEPPDYYGEPDSTAPPGTYICYLDPQYGPCYIIELENKKPVQLFVPGKDLKFASEGVRRAYMASYAIQTKSALGSGIGVMTVPQNDGTFLNYILTNRHVITNEKGEVESPFVATSLWTGEGQKGVVLGVLPEGAPDMALVAITTRQPLPTIPIVDSSQIAFGQKVFAIGNPLGLMGTVTAGVISHPNRPDLGGENVGGRIIQFDSPISPGNSGGPLISEDGKLIGINTFTIPGRPGVPAQNLNFAFPADIGFQMLWAMLQQQLRPAA